MKRMVLALGAAAAVALLMVARNIPFGPIDLAEAERLSARALDVQERLHGDRARMDVIAPDGTGAVAPLSVVGPPRLVACPIVDADWGEIRGNPRFSSNDVDLSPRSTRYDCLLEAQTADGTVLWLGVGILRSDDPELGSLGGYDSWMLPDVHIRRAMDSLGVARPTMARVARRTMRAGLEARGVVFREGE